MKTVLLLLAVIGLCLCAAQAATPSPTAGTSQIVKPASSWAVAQTTLPTVAGLSTGSSSLTVPMTATQITSPTVSPTPRSVTPRSTVTTATPSTKATTPRPSEMPTTAAIATTEAPTAGQNLTVPVVTSSIIATSPTVWLNVTIYDYSPTESRTPDIDPGMTPYSGLTLPETAEPTPTWETPGNAGIATPADATMAIPFFTGEAGRSPTFEIPPGAYGVEQVPSSTPTVTPFPGLMPQGDTGSSFLPRWLSYLLFVLLGISCVACLALIGSFIGSRSARESVPAPVPLPTATPRVREVPLLQSGAPKPTTEQQILIDRIAGFAPHTMHVERLGQNLLRLEYNVQVSSQDRSIRLGQLLVFSAIPSAPVPSPVRAWAGSHGFRILAVDGSGMVLVMPALSTGGRSILGVLPVGEIVEGASPNPMPVLPTESEQGVTPRRASGGNSGVL